MAAHRRGWASDRIIRIPTADNFWRMGDTWGRAARARKSSTITAPLFPGGPPGSPEEDGDRFIEIWNLVFMQYEEGPPGTRASPCPAPRSTPASAWSGSPPMLARRARQLRHRHLPRPHPGQRRDHRTGAGRAVPRQPPSGGGPPARHRVPDRRRRAAVQRGPRLRAAPHHAPRHAPPAPDGRRPTR